MNQDDIIRSGVIVKTPGSDNDEDFPKMGP